MTFLGDLAVGRYVPGDSPVHRLEPRAKLLAAALLLAGSFGGASLLSVAAPWPLLLLALCSSRVGLREFLRGYRPLLWLLVLGALLHAVTTPGRPLWPTPVFGVTWTAEGLRLGLRAAAQLATAMGFASLLTLTTPPEGLMLGLSRLLSPFRRLGLPVEEFFLSALLALRFFPLLDRECDAVFSEPAPKRRWKERLETLLRRVVRRAGELSAEAEAALPRAEARSWRAADWAALTASAATLAAVLLAGGRAGA